METPTPDDWNPSDTITFEEQNLTDAPQSAKDRYEICKGCEHLTGAFRQCKLCWCVMPFKVRMPNESCPDGKW